MGQAGANTLGGLVRPPAQGRGAGHVNGRVPMTCPSFHSARCTRTLSTQATGAGLRPSCAVTGLRVSPMRWVRVPPVRTWARERVPLPDDSGAVLAAQFQASPARYAGWAAAAHNHWRTPPPRISKERAMTAMWVLGAFALLLDCALIWAALAVAARSDDLAGER